MTGEGRPKTLPKPPERNDYEVSIHLLNTLWSHSNIRTLSYKNMVAEGVRNAIEKLVIEGFWEEIDGVLHRYTKYNILHIRATKKEKSVTDAVPESGQSQSTAADGVLSPSA